MTANELLLKEPSEEAFGRLESRLFLQPRKRWAENATGDLIIVWAATGDWLIAFAALWIIFRVDQTGTAYRIPVLHSGNGYSIFGALTLVSVLSAAGIYSQRRLMDLQEILARLLRSAALWSVFFGGFIALLGGFSSSSMAFASESAGLAAAGLVGWRLFLDRIVHDESIASHLRQRILLIGWTPEAGRLSQSVWQQRKDPCEIVGYVDFPNSQSQCGAPANVPFLGEVTSLPSVLEDYDINVAWLSDVNVDGGRIPLLAAQCEKEMVEFKIIPSAFPILLSAMHVENVCETPILGIDRLPLNLFHSRLLKRVFDIAGAAVGVVVTAPLVAVFCAIVYSESPGPVFYRQTRMGRKGEPFDIIKIRSMRLDAEKTGRPGWTTKDDPRRLRIGSFMRKWNIDELPQFWNVFKGDMSLVGPRPERPELISTFKHEIEHYNARHSVKPGVTGWAQVNGLRGDTDLSERIRHDIYYLEHWSIFFDLRIMFLTFFRHSNAC